MEKFHQIPDHKMIIPVITRTQGTDKIFYQIKKRVFQQKAYSPQISKSFVV